MTRLYKVREIAELARVQEMTARRWIYRGELRATYLGRNVRVSEEDFQSFLSRQAPKRAAK